MKQPPVTTSAVLYFLEHIWNLSMLQEYTFAILVIFYAIWEVPLCMFDTSMCKFRVSENPTVFSGFSLQEERF
jgi:hypothetical protein